jgi:L-seryl-tRNA(Ser) seleniumtransferase
MTIAALEGTLRLYYDESQAIKSIPTLRMILKDKDELLIEATALSTKINALSNELRSEVIGLNSTVGGGSLPTSKLPSYGVSIQIKNTSLQGLEAFMRMNMIPIIGRIVNEQYLIDIRTLCEGDDAIILQALCSWGESPCEI